MAVDIFLKLSNNIKGESQDDTHRDEIDVLAWNWGLTQSGTTHIGKGGGGGKVNVQDITLTKYVDLASNDLIKRCTNGEHLEHGELIVRKSGGTAPVEYFRIKMENIMITSYSTGGQKDGLDRIQETLTLNFRKFEVLYTLQEDSGASGAETLAGWDIAENKEWNS
ncbi:type VI secretion system secreted protein Hcp [Paracoccus alcaliphilus]|uniref:Type VI secretion system secreted protein Hcp n=1 Tax=Paracoccus alcaliphilus TaxID=34002 RepID=A0A1H8HF85_9RHOB|nr:type VI secretion system tube protein Hcp [Paracoccus alcaliphilus]WCR20698.1 type VI secretion system tube protein Hcp [Paracoccus alcaliphilus]SEN54922.1 type VI secretion system secreted protein Hcp [Paracoccus alcaliphilus]